MLMGDFYQWGEEGVGVGALHTMNRFVQMKRRLSQVARATDGARDGRVPPVAVETQDNPSLVGGR